MKRPGGWPSLKKAVEEKARRLNRKADEKEMRKELLYNTSAAAAAAAAAATAAAVGTGAQKLEGAKRERNPANKGSE